MKRFFAIILSLINWNFSIAQENLSTDTSDVVVRFFDNNELQEFKKDKEFYYDGFDDPSKGLWERFWEWVWWRAHEIMRTKNGRTTVWTILIGLGIAAIVFFVVKVMGMRSGGLFARDAGSSLPYTTETEDINRISFDDAIKEAVENRNFRLATRLLYLQSLKRLSDKGYIQWQLNKSNNDYIREVTGKPWHSLFKKLTYSFEYTWYGEMNLANDEFQNLQVQFQQFNNQL